MQQRTVQPLVNGNLEVSIPVYIMRDRNSLSLHKVVDGEKLKWNRLTPLRRRLVLGYQLLDKWEKNPLKSGLTLSEEESIDRSLFLKIMGLVNLAPDIVEGIMEEPPKFDFSIKKLFSHRLPDDWNEQRKFLGLRKKNYAAR